MKNEVKVTAFAGQCYGFDGLPIRIACHYEGQPVEFEKGKDFHGTYHLDDGDMNELYKRYPERIPKIGAAYYTSVIDWGYDVEDQLFRLMLFGLELDRSPNVIFKWVGPTWNAEKQRNTPRKKPRNPCLNW